MRYLARLFKVGVLTGGELRMGHEGVVQGSACRPVLAEMRASDPAMQYLVYPIPLLAPVTRAG